MTMEFILTSSAYDGMIVELHDALFPFPIPMGIGVISNGSITFNVNPFISFALRIQDGTTVLRSGVQPLTIGEVDASGDFSVTYLVMHITDPNDTVFSTGDLAAGMSLPIVESGLTVSTLNLATSGGNLVASGTGSYDAGILGNIPINYTYTFTMEPNITATSSRLLNVVTVSSSVTGAAGGLFGWLVNAIVGFLTIMFHGTIADRIESTVQAQVDDEIEAQMSASGAPSEAQATLQSVTISSGDVTVDPLVMIPLSAISCPFFLTSGSIRMRDRGQLRKLRAMRDNALKGMPQGDAYIAILQRHGPELVRLFSKNPELLKMADALIKRGLEDFQEDAPEKGVLSKESARAAQELFRTLAKQEGCSRELRATIERSLPEIEDFIDKPVSRVLKESSEGLRKLGDR
jgi:hypothetical protein